MISPERFIALVAEVTHIRVRESGAAHPVDVMAEMSSVGEALAEGLWILEKEGDSNV